MCIINKDLRLIANDSGRYCRNIGERLARGLRQRLVMEKLPVGQNFKEREAVIRAACKHKAPRRSGKAGECVHLCEPRVEAVDDMI